MSEEKVSEKVAEKVAKKSASLLRAKDPKTTEPSKPKILIFGAPGAGKTWFSLSFPNVYYLDCEGGASRAHYMERLAKAGGKYLGTEDGANDFKVILEQFKALATEKHEFKTVVVDSITKPFNTAVAQEAERLGEKNAFGADKKPAIAWMRRLVAATNRLDMNVIFVSHEKPEWGTDANGVRSEMGKTFDVWDKLGYELDLAFQVQKRGASRFAVIRKSRLLGFPESESFELTFDEFAKRYGKDTIIKPAAPISIASPEQTAEVIRLIDLLKIPAETVEKWLEKANADSLADFTESQASKVIENLQNKLKGEK